MPDTESRDTPRNGPLIWGLYGARTGDNAQVMALSQALGGTVLDKRLDYSPLYGLPNILTGATPSTVAKPARAQLAPPWPDIVIASGRRAVPPARWIKEQSGNQTKLIQIGRPRAPLDWFDLVITTAQYGLPAADNVLCLSLPLQPADALEDESTEPSFGARKQLPRPWTGLLVGGSTWPFVLDKGAAMALAHDMNRWVGDFGGSLLITTSPRTDAAAAQILASAMDVPHFLHRWRPDAENPYRAILQSADQVVVTSDSISMLTDAVRSGKPVGLWNAPLRTDPASRLCLSLGRQAGRDTVIGRLLRTSAFKGLFTPPRHVSRLTEAVVASQRASWFSPEKKIPIPVTNDSDDDMAVAVSRIRALFA